AFRRDRTRLSAAGLEGPPRLSASGTRTDAGGFGRGGRAVRRREHALRRTAGTRAPDRRRSAQISSRRTDIFAGGFLPGSAAPGTAGIAANPEERAASPYA